MAIDQRDITSQLRMMDDRALQQYAAMHKTTRTFFPWPSKKARTVRGYA
jgi:steroid 5-alpha reductase family enzyme